jgi:uncharacterized membrane protein YjgN (DUF898 family)
MQDNIRSPHAGDAMASAMGHSMALPVERHRPEFSGRTGEYFGIWFVNLILSVLTLGIYSAWAKVRTERYFYGNTKLAGASFEYLASPIAILKGRLIAYAVVLALGLSARFSIGTYVVLILLVSVLMPMIIVLGLRFRARNSAWRGLSFRFDREAGSGYGPFMGWPILSSMTMSLLYPAMKRRQHEYVVEGHKFGGNRFDFRGESGAYYMPYLLVVGGVIGLVVLTVVATGIVSAAMGPGDGTAKPNLTILYASILAVYAAFFALLVFLRTRYVNLLWNNSHLDEHRFESTLRARDMLWIYASNAVAIVCTLGLAVPWAMVRLARYRAGHFAVVARGSIDQFVADADRQRSATGAELVDALDVGVDLGF